MKYFPLIVLAFTSQLTVTPTLADSCKSRTVLKREGSFQSPNYPNQYPNRATCEWLIEIPHDIKAQKPFITLEFKNFNVKMHPRCNYDKVLVYDGWESENTLIGPFCGNNTPSPIHATSGKMLVKFISDDTKTATGFNATFEFTSTLLDSCKSRTVLKREGSFQSPNYPNQYPNRATCEWLIEIPHDIKAQKPFITLEFKNFNVEMHPRCDYDEVLVYDGWESNSTLIRPFCGRYTPSPIHATSGKMLVKFTSDDTVTATGFNATFEFTSLSDSCKSRTVLEREGSFQSPNYPNQYPNRATCEWLIEIPHDIKAQKPFITLEFKNFNVKMHPRCNYDKVLVYDGWESENTLIGPFCGNNTPSPIHATSGKMLVKFISDDTKTATGFNATFEFTSTLLDSCKNRTVLKREGSFQSPNYPNQYPNRATCEWLIEIPHDIKAQKPFITLEFKNFNVEMHPRCTYDKVLVYDGWESNRTLIRSFCGRNTPPPFRVTSGKMLVKFTSDYTETATGFNATFEFTSSLACPDYCVCPSSPAILVDCRRANLTSIPSGTLRDFVAVDLSENYIENITALDFRSFANLLYLYLSNNKIKRLSNGTFREAKKIQELLLPRNEISHLEGDSFAGLEETLALLFLSQNKLTNLARESFHDLRALKSL
ncbi:tolloid-like protein 1 [Acropora millepora]|uniref:tolloid-like protein 1 n=1 Tax=Acropora millepora TaxID=45264 RepID=UPI001CF24A54|nr:tolloid-like protein 1 [Acropora millepora]